MDLLPLRKLSLLFLIISALLVSTSYAGRPSDFLTKSYAEEINGAYEELPFVEEVTIVHERILSQMNAHDYGRADPPPILKPSHKLISRDH